MPTEAEITLRDQSVVLAIRLPRALLGLAVGGGLAIAGAAMQGLFRNPLADPGLIGVSTGAALGAVAIIVLGGVLLGGLDQALRPLVLPIAAFIGGLIVTLIVQRIATRDGVIDIATMLLAGIAINALAGALLGIFTFISNDQQLRELTFWMMGSLAAITWTSLLPAIGLMVLPALLLPRMARALNALLLGEAEAHYLGFDVDRTKRMIIVLTALITGAGVAVSGVIGFGRSGHAASGAPCDWAGSSLSAAGLSSAGRLPFVARRHGRAHGGFASRAADRHRHCLFWRPLFPLASRPEGGLGPQPLREARDVGIELDGGGQGPQPLLVAQNTTVEIGKARLLDDVSLSLYPGTVTCLLGPNGAGKSTLLRVLAGALQPSQGEVQFGSRSHDLFSGRPPGREMARRAGGAVAKPPRSALPSRRGGGGGAWPEPPCSA